MSVFSIAPYFLFRRIKIVKQSILPDTSETRISVEPNRRFHPYLRVTHHLALYIHQLCQFMTVSEVAKHVKLDWKTVKILIKCIRRRTKSPRKKGTG